MAEHKVVKFRRGTTSQNQTLVGAEGEVTVDLDKKTLVVHDGATTGGFPLRRDDAEFARQYYIEFKTAIVQNGIPFLGVSTGQNAPIPIAVQTAAGFFTAVASFSQNVQQKFNGVFPMPANWPRTPIFCKLLWRTTDIVDPVTWQLEVGGITDGDTLEGFVFAPIMTFPTFTPTAPNQLITSTITIDSTFLNDIDAGGEFLFRLRRGIDASPAAADVFSVRFNMDRLSV